jgi:hypothetical protein
MYVKLRAMHLYRFSANTHLFGCAASYFAGAPVFLFEVENLGAQTQLPLLVIYLFGCALEGDYY